MGEADCWVLEVFNVLVLLESALVHLCFFFAIIFNSEFELPVTFN